VSIPPEKNHLGRREQGAIVSSSLGGATLVRRGASRSDGKKRKAKKSLKKDSDTMKTAGRMRGGGGSESPRRELIWYL